MKLASGIISSSTNIDGVLSQETLYAADKSIKVTYMQFVSRHTADVTLNLYIVFLNGEISILPIDTNISFTNKTILQFDVDYDLENIEYIYATVSIPDVIHYYIGGELQ
jgi:hypothetical protein